MSSHASTKIDQKEYLKKYLSGDKVKKKKKDKKHKKETTVKVKIIDDDASAFHGDQYEIDEELLLGGEDAPQIVGEYVEERANGSRAPKWRSITLKEEQLEDEENTSAVEVKQEPTESDLWGRKAVSTKVKDDFSPTRRKQKHQHTPDNSPPRRGRDQNRRLNFLQSPARKSAHSPASSKRRSRSADYQRKVGSDKSPPRKSKRSPGKSKRKSRSADRSPVRRRRKGASPRNSRTQRDRSRSSNQSPPRPRRKSVNANQSSPRRRRKSADSDQSPPRRRRKSIDSDQSPPRRRDTDKSSKRPPPQHRCQRSPHQFQCKRRDSDQSPRRKRRDSDQSPRRKRRDSDQSPPRKRMPSLSPTRIKREKLTPDQSPPRRAAATKHERSATPPRRSRWEQRNSDSPPPTHKPKATKTLDGKKAGLQDAQALKVETEERRRQEDRLYARMSGDVSGRDAEVQVRSTGRRGRRARDAQAEDPEVQRRKEEREQQKKQLYDRWGKGLKQIEAHRERLQEQEYESSKPLARYSNDADLDQHLREQERADDPMLEYMRQKRKERQTERNVPTMPVYEGSFPENRFGIRPGYRWDGVDRSNGYEKRWFDKQNEQRAVQDEAYKYSVEDM